MRWMILAFVVACVGVLGLFVLRESIPHPPVTSLISAVREGDAEAARRMIAEGADPDQPGGENHWTPLLHAIHKDQIESVRALIEGGADVSRSVAHGFTPLLMAAAYGQTATVELLLDNGADVHARTVHGMSALDFAMLGSPNPDSFTAFRCQPETVAAIRRRAPDLEPRGGWFEKMFLRVKACPYDAGEPPA